MSKHTTPLSPWRERIYEIIFEADTPEGKLFDVVLLVMILGSVLAVMLETVEEVEQSYGNLFFILEWAFTIFFTIEYVLRLLSARRPLKYAKSFYGIIDLLAIVPTYLSFFIIGTQYFLVIRAFRLIRVFRIFKLAQFLNEGEVITTALKRSKNKIFVFLLFIVLMVVIIGSIIYFIEGGTPNSKFTSIPRSVYWAVVTITTVGYGDISPVTPIGQFLAAIVMIMGYGVIAVPTGIVTSELTRTEKTQEEMSTQVCPNCMSEGHDADAEYCKICGEELNEH